ncbi:DNA primase [Maricaulis sp. D1M11]|uniref:DNA primase n=1 Tax=Maricaulis sp. D1M11 TaxID=3076117 RepID=UPI0039B4C68A
MRLGEDFIDEIKARVRPSDLIGRTVALKRQGREFAGLSPFKKEKTPSFFVNDEKKFYHCFASGKHGDVFSWLQEIEGLSFMEAAERLAGEAGIVLPAADPKAAEKAERRRSLVEWMDAAQVFFQRSLMSPRGEEARAYLQRRGLSPADWKRFGIGFAPDSRGALKDELTTAGAPIKDLVECGLLIAPDDGGRPYDRFRGRVMFPIHDPRGRLVAFGGRAMSKDVRAKYLNSPETPIFHKGDCLYRYPEARRAASNPTESIRGLIVAEGYMDVIALARAGLGHAVAPLGTALTEGQLQLLWRAGGEAVLCFDGDSAGRRAAFSAADRALPLLKAGRSIRFVFLPDGADPDDVLRDQGAEALRSMLSQTRSLADMLWEREVAFEPLDDPDRRAGFRRRVRTLLAKIEDGDIKAEYKREFDQRMDVLFGTAPPRKTGAGPASRSGGGGFQRAGGKWQPRGLPAGATPELLKTRSQTGDRLHPNGRLLLRAAVEWPDLAYDQMEKLSELSFGTLDSLRDAVLDACSSGQDVSVAEVRAVLEARGFTAALKQLDKDKQPMLAAMGGADALLEVRSEAWTRLADAYIQKSESRQRRDEVRARLLEEIGKDDSESVRLLVEANKREISRPDESTN